MSTRLRWRVAPAAFAVVLTTSAAFAQYRIDRHTIDGGGGRSAAGDFAVHGSIAQPDAQAPMHGGDFALQGGFWRVARAPDTPTRLFADGFEP